MTDISDRLIAGMKKGWLRRSARNRLMLDAIMEINRLNLALMERQNVYYPLLVDESGDVVGGASKDGLNPANISRLDAPAA